MIVWRKPYWTVKMVQETGPTSWVQNVTKPEKWEETWLPIFLFFVGNGFLVVCRNCNWSSFLIECLEKKKYYLHNVIDEKKKIRVWGENHQISSSTLLRTIPILQENEWHLKIPKTKLVYNGQKKLKAFFNRCCFAIFSETCPTLKKLNSHNIFTTNENRLFFA